MSQVTLFLHQKNQQLSTWARRARHKAGVWVIKQLDCALNLSSLRDINNKIHRDYKWWLLRARWAQALTQLMVKNSISLLHWCWPHNRSLTALLSSQDSHLWLDDDKYSHTVENCGDTSSQHQKSCLLGLSSHLSIIPSSFRCKPISHILYQTLSLFGGDTCFSASKLVQQGNRATELSPPDL